MRITADSGRSDRWNGTDRAASGGSNRSVKDLPFFRSRAVTNTEMGNERKISNSEKDVILVTNLQLLWLFRGKRLRVADEMNPP